MHLEGSQEQGMPSTNTPIRKQYCFNKNKVSLEHKRIAGAGDKGEFQETSAGLGRSSGVEGQHIQGCGMCSALSSQQSSVCVSRKPWEQIFSFSIEK